MKRPLHFASVLFIAAAVGLWAWQHAPAADRVAGVLPDAQRTVMR